MKIDKNYAAYWLIVVVIFCLLSMGCASRKPAILPPVYAGVASDYDSVRTDRTEHVQHDSIYIFEKETIYQKGDTVYQDRWHTVYKSVIDKRTDTLYVEVVKADTVQVVVPVQVENKSLPLGKRILVGLGVIAFLVVPVQVENKSLPLGKRILVSLGVIAFLVVALFWLLWLAEKLLK